MYGHQDTKCDNLVNTETSNHDPAEDFTVSRQGTVGDFFTAGLVTAALNLP
jgi:hypothetical protein